MVLEGEGGQGERLDHGEGLDRDEELALVGPVGDQAGEGAEEQHRAELGGGQQRRGRRRCR